MHKDTIPDWKTIPTQMSVVAQVLAMGFMRARQRAKQDNSVPRTSEEKVHGFLPQEVGILRHRFKEDQTNGRIER